MAGRLAKSVHLFPEPFYEDWVSDEHVLSFGLNGLFMLIVVKLLKENEMS